MLCMLIYVCNIEFYVHCQCSCVSSKWEDIHGMYKNTVVHIKDASDIPLDIIILTYGMYKNTVLHIKDACVLEHMVLDSRIGRRI